MHRRQFLVGGSLVALGAAAPELFRQSLAGAATPGPGPYGALGAADANGIALPAGFTSREIARTGATIGTHPWHAAPDGGACFPSASGGWVYVSNSEVGSGQGGVSAIRFLADGTVDDAYGILTGTSRNCAGGPTPWGTWLSCEENGAGGQVYECDPQSVGQGVVRPALGSFAHEAVAVDTATGDLYLTEDHPQSRLYRFVPTTAGDLTTGILYAAAVAGSTVSWIPTSAAGPDRNPATAEFNGGEGIWHDAGSIYFTTKGDRRVWEFVPATSQLTVLHDYVAEGGSLNAVDNVTVHAASGDVYVAEDGGNMELGVIAMVEGVRQVAAFCRIDGHDGSEIAGPAFSPDGTRLYLSSQRGADGSTGVTYEITGPFRTDSPGPAPVTTTHAVDDDTYVRGGSRQDNSYGTSTLLAVKENNNLNYTRWAFLAIDTDSVTEPVTEARLRLWSRVTSDQTTQLEVVAVSDTSWSGSSLTWSNKPPVGPVLASYEVASASSTLHEIDVTDWVAARKAEGNHRVAFAVRQVQAGGPMCIVNSIENSSGRPDLVITSDGSPPPPPPPNVGPTASFVSATQGLDVTTDAASSSDDDGSIVSYDWDFGDWSAATGVTAAHTYATAGTYAVTLTVTDDDGAQGVITHDAIVAEPPPAATLAADDFERSVAGGLGVATVGGPWSTSGSSSNYAVTGGRGRITIPSGGVSRAATLASVDAADVELLFHLRLDKQTTGGGLYVSSVVRKSGNSEYRLRVKVRPTSTQVQLRRRTNGSEATLASTTLAGAVYQAGSDLHVRFSAIGTVPSLIGRVWFDGDPEPTSPQIDVVDGSAPLQQSGAVGIHAYYSSSASNAPLEVSIDDLHADDLTGA